MVILTVSVEEGKETPRAQVKTYGGVQWGVVMRGGMICFGNQFSPPPTEIHRVE